MVGLVLLRTLGTSVVGVTNATGTNVTGGSAVVVNLIPLFFALGLLVGGAAILFNQLIESGLF